ncbi:MAG: hypothetical protein M5U26_23175 [Planctomycetota bacterium]|nr:hypothetical protein [Planctomycetota bacterium]
MKARVKATPCNILEPVMDFIERNPKKGVHWLCYALFGCDGKENPVGYMSPILASSALALADKMERAGHTQLAAECLVVAGSFCASNIGLDVCRRAWKFAQEHSEGIKKNELTSINHNLINALVKRKRWREATMVLNRALCCEQTAYKFYYDYEPEHYIQTLEAHGQDVTKAKKIVARFEVCRLASERRKAVST